MLGTSSAFWTNELISALLPALVEEFGGGVPYWPSTPTGPPLPFHTEAGLTHYYGVGAYKRPLADCRLAQVKFSPECLGFSHIPEPANLQILALGAHPPPHDPRWKVGVPRDSGAGWDFEDIRDFYLELIYGVDPVELRSHDLDRYYRLSRAVTGQFWRASSTSGGRQSTCSGGLYGS